MSMDKTAIQEIIKHANTGNVMEQVTSAGTKSTVIALPEDFLLKDLESFMPNRDSFRAVMETQVIGEFVRYNEQYSVDGESQCFIDVDVMSAKSIFDLGGTEKAGHCRHKSILTLKKTALYIDVLKFNNTAHPQRDAAEWIEDHAEYLEAYDTEGQKMDIASVSVAIRNLTVSREQGRTSAEEDFAARQSEYDNVAIKTKDGLAMPAVLKFKCEPYNGLTLRAFELRHSIIEKGGKPFVNFRIKMLEKHQEDMAVEFKEILDAKLAEVIPVYIGTLSA